MKTAIPLPLDKIEELCRKYEVTELSVFGSVLREDFGPASDVDFLAVFRNDDLGPWMGKLFEMQEELSEMLDRPVEIVEKQAVLDSENYIRQRSILGSAETVYAER